MTLSHWWIVITHQEAEQLESLLTGLSRTQIQLLACGSALSLLFCFLFWKSDVGRKVGRLSHLVLSIDGRQATPNRASTLHQRSKT